MLEWGMFFVFQVVIILTVSFFILLGVTHTESKGLRVFGRMLAFTLWILVIYLVTTSFYSQYLCNKYLHKASYRCYHRIR